jgi:hypothetical protein
MKASHIVCAILACAPLTFEARATASSEDGRPSRPAANAGQAAGRTAPSRDESAKPEGTRDREPTHARGRTGGGSTGGGSTGGASKGRDAAAAATPRGGSVTPGPGSATPQRGAAPVGVAQAGRGNADRLRSLLNAKAHGRLARQPSRPVGSTHAAAGGPAVRGPQGVGPAGQPKLAAANSTASPAARPLATPRTSTIGGPHAQGSGRVGGPAVSRTTHSATVDGTQLHHKP